MVALAIRILAAEAEGREGPKEAVVDAALFERIPPLLEFGADLLVSLDLPDVGTFGQSTVQILNVTNREHRTSRKPRRA